MRERKKTKNEDDAKREDEKGKAKAKNEDEAKKEEKRKSKE